MGKGGGRFHSSLSREERKEREKRERRERKEREKRDKRERNPQNTRAFPLNPAGFRSDCLSLYLEFKMTDGSTNALAAKQWFFPYANLFLEG